ncbi:MAG: hypothetical protein KAI47_20420, partial [Deltaproteobacteria bacterium]|nr:hypothetical protein [Deltaproteobacteria bacterium]
MKTSAHTSSLALFATALLLAACDSGSAIPATDIGIDHALSFSDSIAEMLGEDAPRSLDATREDATSDTSILNDGMSKEDHGPCVPSCPGRTCGNDGCGGRCGSCSGESICSQAGSCVKAIYPPSGHETGVDYHATGSDFLTTAFLTRYHQPQVRTLVKSQLAGMRQAGATVISTRIWLVSPPGTTGAYSWKHHFPLNTQEIANIRAYAQDVASAKLKLYIIFLYLWCAEYSVGSPTATLGHCGLSAPSFVSRVKQSINGVLDNIHDIYLSNGLPVVERVYLDGEVMTASSASDPATAFEKKNQRWFLKDSGLWSYFVNQVRHEGMIPMLYFIHGNGETDILDEDFKDTYLPALTRHRSMYWIYRTLKFLKDNGLPIPGRVDFSSYPHPEHTNYATLFNRIFSDYASTIPTLLGGKKDFFVAETFYHPNAITRARAHRGLSLQYALRPSLRGISFWTTPDAGGTGVHAGYPFDIQGLNGSGLSF